MTYRQRKEAIERRAANRATGANAVELLVQSDGHSDAVQGVPVVGQASELGVGRGTGSGRPSGPEGQNWDQGVSRGSGRGRPSGRGPGRPRGGRSVRGSCVGRGLGVSNPFSSNHIRGNF